jgi:GAF domain-containing protein
LRPRAYFGWLDEEVALLKLAKGYGSQSGYTMLQKEPVVVDDYLRETRFEFPQGVLERGIKSGLSVPMMRGDEIIGAMLVYSTQYRHFTAEDCYLLQLIAEQTAIAIRSTERYEQLQRRNNHFQAIHNASKAITASFGRERDVLDEIVRQAVEGLTEAGSSKVAVGTIQIYDEMRSASQMISIYPADKFPDLSKRVGDVWSLDRSKEKIGIAGRTILEGKSQRVDDVSLDPDYLSFNKATRSELCVPMWDGDKVIGAINVESHDLKGFDDDDQTTLETLAEHAVIAIKNARQFEELKDSKLQIGARTALAWMGMANNAWRHVIARDASEIANRATLIRELIQKNGVDQARIADHLKQIESLVKSIHEKPITAPLSSEEGVALVNINDLVVERLNQLRHNARYSSIKLEAQAYPYRNLTVQVSSEWLRRALDILVDNAADSVKSLDTDRRSIIVTTSLLNGEVKVCVADCGLGIPEEIKPLLFKTRVEQSNGFGMGLLIAQAIVETYGGKIELEDSNEQGTRMTIRLPHKS